MGSEIVLEKEIQLSMKEYQEWRKSINFMRKPVPDLFWDKFKQLQEMFPHRDIKNIFKLNNASWNKKVLGVVPKNTKPVSKKLKKKKQYKKVSDNEDSSFIVIPSPNSPTQNLTTLMKLKLKNGTEITVYQ